MYSVSFLSSVLLNRQRITAVALASGGTIQVWTKLTKSEIGYFYGLTCISSVKKVCFPELNAAQQTGANKFLFLQFLPHLKKSADFFFSVKEKNHLYQRDE